MGLYRKKPVVINAIQWTGENTPEVMEFCETKAWKMGTHALCISTLEGVMTAFRGDYIIRGVQGEYYPCKQDIFAQTYEPVEEE